ncbi:MAG: TRAP transporter substrate-binding protein [Cytophagales bacterium]|nr:TRAP transporter substrate-binding protein [Cytophagales bacterium]MDW8384926.1 TRAP transporter substrate-binding protein [Flammeovirgaceae bacterium]
MKKTFYWIIALLSASCSQISDSRVLKLAHGLDAQHPVHLAMEYMAKRVAEKSGGKLTIQIYTSGQLGSERECLELLQIGSLAMTKVSSAVMENFAPNFKALGLPYIFRSRQHQFKVLDGPIGQELLVQAEKYWLRGLCFYDAGSRSFYTTKKPIYSPEDLQGLKIRVMKSQTAIEMVNALGGSPTPISFGELFTALQQGVVDGAENNPPSFVTSRHYEVCKYYTLNEHTSVPDVLIISTKVWNLLSEQEKKWLLEAAQESVIEQRRLWEISENECLALLEKEGVQIIRPDKTVFAQKVAALAENYRNEPEIYSYIQRIRATQE